VSEFALIDRIRARVTARDDVLLGIGDDAAIVRVPPGRDLLIATDTLNRGIHFPDNTLPDQLGWKTLAVNLSDLAAMAAQPAWCTLSLSLPQADMTWVDAFLDGFCAIAQLHGVALVGGDTTRGPLSVSVTVCGFAEPGRALRRSGARSGDDIWVTGTLGDAAGALAQWRSGGAVHAALRDRLDRPTPRVAEGLALAGLAHAGIDLSDGLLADLGHVCDASGVGAVVDVDSLPTSAVLAEIFEPDRRRALQAAGGDDYELCFTAPASARAALEAAAARIGTPFTRIGAIVEGQGVQARRADGGTWEPASRGFVHFG
jgi:thiamine-monophosphate kinase